MDYTKLKKGDTIACSQIEEITGLECTHPDYRLAMLHVKHDIETTLRCVTVREIQGDLVILTDSQASTYNFFRFKTGIRKLTRSYHQMKQVNQKNLTHHEKQTYFRRVEVMTRIIQSVQNELKLSGFGEERDRLGLPNINISTTIKVA